MPSREAGLDCRGFGLDSCPRSASVENPKLAPKGAARTRSTGSISWKQPFMHWDLLGHFSENRIDPLLRRTPLVVKPHHRPARRLQVGHDESDSWEQLPAVELHLRHHTPRRLPARGLVEKTLVPHHRLVARSS